MPDKTIISELLTLYLPWVNGVLSIITAYLLSNRKVTIGRVIGVFTATSWFVYGLASNQYAFVFTEIIFLWIYIGAILKFNKKRNSYRQMKSLDDRQKTELKDQLDDILELMNKINDLKEKAQDKYDEEHIENLETKLYHKITKMEKEFE